MAGFQFKRFYVEHERSSMRVGTDAVLLGVAARVEKAEHVLDVGTGCGVITLVMAQKTAARITAIDIDRQSVGEAEKNFAASPWAQRLKAVHNALQSHLKGLRSRYDVIVSNPPFFQDSLRAPDKVRSQARHNDALSYEELAGESSRLLTTRGALWVILPINESRKFEKIAGNYGLFLKYELLIHPKPGREPNRRITGFVTSAEEHAEKDELIIRQENNEFTRAYKKFISDYYLHF